MSLETVKQLMSEIGPLLDNLVEIHEFESETMEWELVFEEGIGIVVQYSQAARKLVFTINVGDPAAENRLELYDSLLTFNGLGEETDGIRLGLDAPEGAVLVMFDLFATDLDAPTLKSVLENLVVTGLTWSELVGGTYEPAATQDSGPDAQSTDAIRV